MNTDLLVSELASAASKAMLHGDHIEALAIGYAVQIIQDKRQTAITFDSLLKDFDYKLGVLNR